MIRYSIDWNGTSLTDSDINTQPRHVERFGQLLNYAVTLQPET